MDLAFEGYLDNNLIEPDDIPKTNDPVWVLGRSYNAIQGKKSSFTQSDSDLFLLGTEASLSAFESAYLSVLESKKVWTDWVNFVSYGLFNYELFFILNSIEIS